MTAILAGAVVDLKSAVIRTVRTSSAEVNRRQDLRIEVDMTCRVSTGGQAAQPGRLGDISKGGACIRDTIAMSPGQQGTAELSGLSRPLPFRVVATDRSGLHVRFNLEAGTTAELEAFIARLGSHQQAA